MLHDRNECHNSMIGDTETVEEMSLDGDSDDENSVQLDRTEEIQMSWEMKMNAEKAMWKQNRG